MRSSKTSDVWSVVIVEATGAHVAQVYRTTRETAEKVVVDYLFDTDGGIGANGTGDQNGYARICVWSEP